MPRFFNSMVLTSVVILTVSSTSVVQAQFDDAPYRYGHYHSPHSHLATPHQFYSHSHWDHGVLMDEPEVIHRSIEPIGNDCGFQEPLAYGHATTDAHFGGCPNAIHCPHDARNFASLHEPPSTYAHPIRPRLSPSPATRHPDSQTPLQPNAPDQNTFDSHNHAGHNHAGHNHAGHNHSGHDHAGHSHAAPRQPNDARYIPPPTLSRPSPGPRETPSDLHSRPAPSRNVSPSNDSQGQQEPIKMDGPPPSF
ncbi:MAG: hypothetical protein NXI28_07665 [bacterium]|nr:hypothetical protein [bacterium]